jgi:hypothetical protein
VTTRPRTSRLSRAAAKFRGWLSAVRFKGSHQYWEQRYAAGGTSGVGSYGKFATFKADVLNRFVREHAVRDLIEFGCGDGSQLELATYPSYVGFDVSETAVQLCRGRFTADATKTFKLLGEYRGEQAELALSLDVIYHLVEDPVFDEYMRRLFAASSRFVIVYASNSTSVEGAFSPHVKHRRFTDWVALHEPSWKLAEHIPNAYPYRGDYQEGSFADFYIFQHTE